MKQVVMQAAVASLFLLLANYYVQPVVADDGALEAGAVTDGMSIQQEPALADGDATVRAVLDISVHSIEGLKVLFDRAEELAMRPQAQGEGASVVLVLHGPEVEFFAIGNYEKYKDIVDQAARLDAFDVVDVKICQTMMGARGIDPGDIPSFIEQVPLGLGEIERLQQEGYVTF